MKKFLVLTLAAGAALAMSVPASAQYYEPDYRYERPPQRWEYQRPQPRWGYERPRAREFSRLCVTSRGDCNSRPAPIGAGCSCFIPGFGMKRGNIE